MYPSIVHTLHIYPWARDIVIVNNYYYSIGYIARERIIGWYHTGPKLHRNDTAIHELIGQYCNDPVSCHDNSMTSL